MSADTARSREQLERLVTRAWVGSGGMGDDSTINRARDDISAALDRLERLEGAGRALLDSKHITADGDVKFSARRLEALAACLDEGEA